MVMHNRFRRAFTLVELLVVIGLIALLIALLAPSLFAVTSASARADSMKRLTQISQWMHLYSSENRQFIVPSRFNYSLDPYKGKVKSEPPARLDRFMGTWTDILWANYFDTSFPHAVTPLGHDYQFDSPDNRYHDLTPNYDDNPFRSALLNEKGPLRQFPGFFAANDFFNADPNSPDFNGWWTEGQIRQPDASLYLIDSFVGETIADDIGPWGIDLGAIINQEVDYRYTGDALILMLDGHIQGEGEVFDLDELETIRRVKVRNLDR